MTDVLLYTTPTCFYCMRAKSLLGSKGVEFREISIMGNPQLRSEMMHKSGRQTVPQIWIGEEHIGGFDELRMLDVKGQLDVKLEVCSA